MKVASLILSLLGSTVPLLAEMPTRGICAHRGDNACFPENTVPAFLSAAEKHAAMVEMDVKRCKTGELIILHDGTVDRTTNGKGKVSDLTFDQLRSLDAGVKKDPKFAGTKIPTFDEAIDCLPKDGIWINVHCSADVTVEVAEKIRQKGRLHQAFIASSLSALAKAKKAVPELLTCNMSRPGKWGKSWPAELSLKYATDTVENKCDFLQLIVPCEESHTKLLHDAKVKVNYFKCDAPDRIPKLRKMGVDFILTDQLDRMMGADR